MKKRFVLSIILVIALSLTLFTGCESEDPDPIPEPESLSIEDYFPIQENVKYVYEGEGNEFASYTVYIDFTSENKMQQRVETGGTVLAKVFKIHDGKLIRTLSREEMYHRENLMDEEEEEEILLMEPIEVGATWTLEDGRTRTIVSLDTEVSTPLADYQAIEVVTEGFDAKMTDYFVEGLGLVKTEFDSEGVVVSSSLKEFSQGAVREEIIEFYFPNIDDERLYYKNTLVSFRTNEDIKSILAQEYKDALVSNVGPVFTANVAINSAIINQDRYLELDLNDAFVSEMNAGSGYEAMILQCVTNTFAKYYNTLGIVLTIEGEPYESGHILLQEGEQIMIDDSNTVEIEL